MPPPPLKITGENNMSFWKKLFKKTKKEQDKHHDEEMKYLKLLAKRMDKIENNLNKKNKKKK